MADYLVRISTEALRELPAEERRALTVRERARGRELVAEGVIKVLWRITGASYNYGVWSAPDDAALHAAFTTLPIFPHVDFEVTPLEPHPVMTGDDSDLGG